MWHARFFWLMASTGLVSFAAGHACWVSIADLAERPGNGLCADGGCASDTGVQETDPGVHEVEAIAERQTKAYLVAVDDTYVYWTCQDGPALQRRAKGLDGGTETIDDTLGGTGVALDDHNVYWASKTGVHKASKDALDAGPEADSLVRAPPDSGKILDVAVRNGIVYWIAWKDANANKAVGEIWSTSVDGDAGALVDNLNAPFFLTVDDDGMYWTDLNTVGIDDDAHNGVRRSFVAETAALDGGNPRGIGRDYTTDWNGNAGRGITTDLNFVYWLEDTGSVWFAPKISPNEASVLPGGGSTFNHRGLAIDRDSNASMLFWAETETNAEDDQGNISAMIASVDSGKKLLANRRLNPHGVAFDQTHVYFTLWGVSASVNPDAYGTQGGVYRVQRPAL